MKTKEKTSLPELPKGYIRMDPIEAERYAKMDLFRDKVNKTNELLRKAGLPAELREDR